jgi:hypothetical protein
MYLMAVIVKPCLPFVLPQFSVQQYRYDSSYFIVQYHGSNTSDSTVFHSDGAHCGLCDTVAYWKRIGRALICIS